MVTLRKKLAEQVTARPITFVLDNARYQRHGWVIAKVARLEMTWLGLPTYSPHCNRIAWLGKCVKCKGRRAIKRVLGGFPGRYDPTCWRLRLATIDCLADTSGRHQAQLDTLLTRKFPALQSAS